MGSYPPEGRTQVQESKFEITLGRKIYRGVEQLVARWAHNPKVTGSSPVPATKIKAIVSLFYALFCNFDPMKIRIGEKKDLPQVLDCLLFQTSRS